MQPRAGSAFYGGATHNRAELSPPEDEQDQGPSPGSQEPVSRAVRPHDSGVEPYTPRPGWSVRAQFEDDRVLEPTSTRPTLADRVPLPWASFDACGNTGRRAYIESSPIWMDHPGFPEC